MGNQSSKSQLVEAIPTRIELPMTPEFDPVTETPKTVGRLRFSKLTSGTRTLSEVEQNRIEISEHFHRRYLQGDIKAVIELLNYRPAFFLETWVEEALLNMMLEGGPPKRGRGRPRGSSKDTTLVGLTIVAYVNWQVRTKGKNVHRVLGELAESGFERLSYDRIKALYYEMRNDIGQQPLFFADEKSRYIRRADV